MYRWCKEARDFVCSGGAGGVCGGGVLYNGTARLTGACEDEKEEAMAVGRSHSEILMSKWKEEGILVKTKEFQARGVSHWCRSGCS